MADSYDLCVIGAGPGGFAAATRAAHRGARVALVEAGELGGACLNRGCIPARAIGATAGLAATLRQADRLGIRVDRYEVQWPQVLARKDRIVRRLREGLRQLVQARRIQLVRGRATLRGAGRVAIESSDGPSEVQAQGIVIATGSRPSPWPSVPCDGRRVLSSDDLLALPSLPKQLVIIGGGVIGCEFASYLAPLGVEVTLLEREPQLLPGHDADVAAALAASLTRAGVRVHTGALVTAVVAGERDVLVRWGAEGRIQAGQALVTVGRAPNTQDLGLEEADVALTARGFVEVDAQLKTSAPSLYAVGDLLGCYQTAYTASCEGAIAAENALGAGRAVEYTVVPDCVFTMPEIAAVGLTEPQARERGMAVGASRVPWSASGRAMTLEETEGFIKVVYETATQRLVGVQLIGPRATDLIAEAALALKQGMTLPAIVEVLHGHPTLAEALWEASAQPLAQALYVQ